MGNNIIDNLSTIYQTKLQIKSALGTTSDDFTEYPEIITRTMNSLSLAGDGGITYSYLSEKLSYYVEIEDLNNAAYCTESDVAYYVATYSPDLTTYATKAYVVNYVNNYSPQLDLSAYVTKVALNAASYASKSYVADYVATYAPQPDLSAYVTHTELNDAGYITSIPSEYITQAELSANAYLTEHQDLSAYATKSYVVDYVSTYAPEPDLSAYATKSYVVDYVATYGGGDLSAYVSKDELYAMSYATESYVVSYVTNYGYDHGHNLVERMEGVEEKTDQLDIRMGYAESYLTSYNTRIYTLEHAGYVSQTSLSSNSYASQTYVTTYVTDKLDEWSGNVKLVYYLNTENFTLPEGQSTFRLSTYGLTYNTYAEIYPKTLTYATNNSQDTYWVSVSTLKNYMNGRLQQLEGSYVSVNYLNNQHFVSQSALSEMTYATEAYVTEKIPSSYDMSLYVTYTYLYSYVGAVMGDLETILANI